MTLEKVFNEIGSFGRYQKRKIFLIGLIYPPLVFFIFSVVFIYETPVHRCYVPEIDQTSLSKEIVKANLSERLEKFIPSIRGENKLSACERFQNITGENNTKDTQFSKIDLNSSENCIEGWVYEGDRVSAVTEFNLVCKDAWKKPLLTSGFMFGMMIAGLCGGTLTDRFGRRPVILVLLAVSLFVHFIMSFTNVYWILLIIVSACGILHSFLFTTSFVLAQELVGINDRAKVTCIINLSCAFGYMMLPAVAYFFMNWRWIVRYNSLFHLIYIPYYWLLPESPRFLFSKGRQAETLSMLRRMAIVNGADAALSKGMVPETLGLIKNGDMERSGNAETKNEGNTESIKMLMKNPIMLKRTLCLFFIWNAGFLCFYASGFNTSNLAGNSYVNCFISAAVEIPAAFLSLYSLQKIGRRNSLFCFLFFAGAGCLLSPSVRDETFSIASAMVAKLFATCSIGSLFLFTSELYPTLLRNTGVGFCTMAARFSTISAPYLVFIGEQAGKAIPFYVMAVTSILGSGILLMLPETFRSPLPETMEDAINLEKHRLNGCRRSTGSEENDVTIT